MITPNLSKERITAFSDAVFAIAITLLVLDIKVPPYEELMEVGFITSLKILFPDFLGFIISFLVIGLYWLAYLRHTRFISHFTLGAFWINICLLLFVVLLPFSTAFYVEAPSLAGPFIFYCANLLFIGFFNYLLLLLVLKQAKGAVDKLEGRYLNFRAITTVLVWAASIILAIFWPGFARFAFLSLFAIQLIGTRYFKKKASRQNLQPQ